EAREVIRHHLNASHEDDAVIFAGNGSTGAAHLLMQTLERADFDVLASAATAESEARRDMHYREDRRAPPHLPGGPPGRAAYARWAGPQRQGPSAPPRIGRATALKLRALLAELEAAIVRGSAQQVFAALGSSPVQTLGWPA
ncbi:unnamed protein product, partial [Prorocentrum cordatum]